MEYTVHLTISPRLQKALQELESVVHFFLKFGELPVYDRNSLVDFFGVDSNLLVTPRTVDGGICLEPSNCLLDFLSAARTRYFVEDVSYIDSHGSPFHE